MGYTGEADTSPKQVMRNEFVKYRMQTSLGQQVNLLDLADGILLQWYSGFDAALCENTYSPSSKACTCDNVPADDYPNVLEQKGCWRSSCVILADILERFWQF